MKRNDVLEFDRNVVFWSSAAARGSFFTHEVEEIPGFWGKLAYGDADGIGTERVGLMELEWDRERERQRASIE